MAGRVRLVKGIPPDVLQVELRKILYHTEDIEDEELTHIMSVVSLESFFVVKRWYSESERLRHQWGRGCLQRDTWFRTKLSSRLSQNLVVSCSVNPNHC